MYGKQGLSGCITPKGLPFNSYAARPVTGIEALMLQGLPCNDLYLTTESAKQCAIAGIVQDFIPLTDWSIQACLIVDQELYLVS